MPFSSGTFSVYTPGNPVVSGTTISSTAFNNTMNDFATGLSTCLLKDGSQTVTANIPMSNFKLTGLAAGTANGDSVCFQQVVIVGSQLTNTISGDVSLSNTGSYFTGPTVAQGTTGVWFASGTVVCWDTAGAAQFNVKLWDGTTLIASATSQSRAANTPMSISISGFISSPAGNIRIDVNDQTSTSGAILFNNSGNSKDSTLSVFRIG